MGGLIGGIFGGGDSGGSTTTQTNQTLQQNSQFSGQDPNAAVSDFQSRFVRNEANPQQQQGTLSGMYQQPKTQQNNGYMAKRGGLWSFFGS